jgi:hypothetical protein
MAGPVARSAAKLVASNAMLATMMAACRVFARQLSMAVPTWALMPRLA